MKKVKGTGGHLIEFHLIEFHLIESVDRKFLIILAAQNSIIRTFDQVPKFASYFLALDRNLLN
jgi:hypothetical protein